jgi:hypothetical protein
VPFPKPRFAADLNSSVRVREAAAVERGPIAAWSLDAVALSKLAAEHGPTYRAGQPFPHIVIDGLQPDELVAEVGATFPAPEDSGWMRLRYEDQHKLQWTDSSETPAVMEAFIAMMQSSRFLAFLEALTGVSGLVGDPHLFHSGPHQSEPGGFLNVHVDQLFQQRLWLYRRVNVIVYFNRMWEPAWGGNLQLWNEEMTTCVREIEPTFNRMVIFESSPISYHGHPEPTAPGPGDVNRKSVALYYYTSPENPATPSTGHDHSLFVEIKPRWRRVLIDLTPPIVKREITRLRSRAR